MNINKGFVVLAVSAIIILGVFMVFVNNGWPGIASKCISTVPNTCYCEAFDTSDVLAHKPGVRQPVNAWSNLYALITSFIVAMTVFKDRRSLGTNTPRNAFKSFSSIPDLYIFTVLFLGLGSMWFHASLTLWGNIIDGASMYVFVAFLIFYSIHRFYASSRFFWIGFLLTVALFSYLHNSLTSLRNTVILVCSYLIVEIYIWIRSGKILQGKKKTVTLWLIAAALMLVAGFFWWAGQTGNFMCDPNSLFQPHGLLWHPLAGVTAVLLYFYWREADDSLL